MKRKYREAMRAAARQQFEPADDDDDDAIEAQEWHDEWAGQQKTESNNDQWSNQ